MSFQKYEVEEYERKRYRDLDQRLVDWQERRILKRIIRQAESQALFVLDIPCGYGRFSDLFLKSDVFLVSCDLSFHMVKRAIEKRAGLSIPFGVVADAVEGLPFKDGTFGMLLSMRFFHHVHEPREQESILKEFCRISSGWVIVSYYQKNRLHHLQRKFRRLIKGSKRKIKMVARSEFRRMAEEVGFEMIEIWPLFPRVHSQHIALLKKR